MGRTLASYVVSLLSGLATSIAFAGVASGATFAVACVALALIALGLLLRVAFGEGHDRPYLVAAMAAAAGVFVSGFAGAYFVIAQNDPGQFSPEGLGVLDSVYLSLATFTTTGYGDVHPTGSMARATASLQMVGTFAYVAVAGSLIVTRLAELRRG